MITAAITELADITDDAVGDEHAAVRDALSLQAGAICALVHLGLMESELSQHPQWAVITSGGRPLGFIHQGTAHGELTKAAHGRALESRSLLFPACRQEFL